MKQTQLRIYNPSAWRTYSSFLTLFLALLLSSTIFAKTYTSEEHRLELTPMVSGLEHPWGMSLLPDGSILVTERGGNLRWWNKGKLSRAITGLPKIADGGQGGLLDIALHPRFVSNRLIYLSYSKSVVGGKTTAVAMAEFDADRLALTGTRDIFLARPAHFSSRHFGSRLLFGEDGLLYISVGDRGKRDLAQDTDNHMGTIIRLRYDGKIPDSNPFVDVPDHRPEIYSYGHRNPQGMAWHPESKSLWIHEHGPRGGDEINQIMAGKNYGWPVITHGKAYSGLSIGEGTSKPGMEQPLWYWVPSIAPSGMVNYRGRMFSGWRGNTLVGSLKFAYLERLVWHNSRVVHREKLIERAIGRIRDVRVGSEGEIYLLNDEKAGGIYKLRLAS